MHRVNSRTKEIRQHHVVAQWDAWYHRSVFKWAGHVARMQQYDHRRLTYRVFKHRCWKWIQAVAASHRGSQLHGKRLRIWRWERPVYKFFGTCCWETAAQDKTEWESQLDKMMQWRGANR